MLLPLELDGRVAQLPGGRYQRIPQVLHEIVYVRYSRLRVRELPARRLPRAGRARHASCPRSASRTTPSRTPCNGWPASNSAGGIAVCAGCRAPASGCTTRRKCAVLPAECRGFLRLPRSRGAIDAVAREMIIERAMAVDSADSPAMSLAKFKVIVLMVMWRRAAFARQSGLRGSARRGRRRQPAAHALTCQRPATGAYDAPLTGPAMP